MSKRVKDLTILFAINEIPTCLEGEIMGDVKVEFDDLLTRIRSPTTRKAGDAFFLADPLDLSVTYSPDNFVKPDAHPDLKSTPTTCMKL